MRMLFQAAGMARLLFVRRYIMFDFPAKVVGCPRRTDSALAKTQVAALSQALLPYQGDVGCYPTSFQGLEALIRAPRDLRNPKRWKGPYLADCTSLPPDSWGHAFSYAGRIDGKACSVTCLGADGRLGGGEAAEDIVKSLTSGP